MSKQITSAFGKQNILILINLIQNLILKVYIQVKLLVSKEDAQKDIKIIDDVIKEQLIIEGKKQPNKTDKFKRAPYPIKKWKMVEFNSILRLNLNQLVDHNTKPIDNNVWGGSI